jgi:hypothetical protein
VASTVPLFLWLKSVDDSSDFMLQSDKPYSNNVRMWIRIYLSGSGSSYYEYVRTSIFINSKPKDIETPSLIGKLFDIVFNDDGSYVSRNSMEPVKVKIESIPEGVPNIAPSNNMRDIEFRYCPFKIGEKLNHSTVVVVKKVPSTCSAFDRDYVSNPTQVWVATIKESPLFVRINPSSITGKHILMKEQIVIIELNCPFTCGDRVNHMRLGTATVVTVILREPYIPSPISSDKMSVWIMLDIPDRRTGDLFIYASVDNCTLIKEQ